MHLLRGTYDGVPVDDAAAAGRRGTPPDDGAQWSRQQAWEQHRCSRSKSTDKGHRRSATQANGEGRITQSAHAAKRQRAKYALDGGASAPRKLLKRHGATQSEISRKFAEYERRSDSAETSEAFFFPIFRCPPLCGGG